MENERWRQIEQLYHSALELEESRREDFINRACFGDESLQHEVRSLLAQIEGAESFLEEPARDVAAKSLASSVAAGENGAATAGSFPAAIGRYRIVRVLGEGGMGIVYEAQQEQPRRSVALKVIKPGFATPERLWRFEHESKALGRLQHPGIAQIYEASTADTGFGPQPYFALELIRGQSLLSHAEVHHLDTRQRLSLVAKICDAVEHAHQRGLIHRDLKPGNILVDETGQPKILDFGVARVTDSNAQVTRQTDLGQILGTLDYMSPEQVKADPQEVDTRSDVYSLGVILYELLSGRLPYDLSRRQLHEAARTIREEDPTALSSISRNYRGDIETIVGKALEKDKARRYSSAADLAADIRRYLHDEPIAARPPSSAYQLQKFARRHRALVMSMAAVFVVLAAGVIVSSILAIRANRAGQVATLERNRAIAEKHRADDEAASANAVSNFLQHDLLSQASAYQQARPGSKPDPDLKVRTALDRAAARIEGKFEKQPLVEASIRQTIGMTYVELGIYPEAQRQLERTIELRRRFLGEDDPGTLTSLRSLATVYLNQGRFGQAEPLYRKVLEVQRRILGEQHADTLQSMFDLGVVYDGEAKYAQAEPLFTKVLDARRRLLGFENPDTLESIYRLGSLYQLQGKYAQAEPLVTRALQVQRRVLGEEHPDTLLSMNNLASLYENQHKYAEAESLFKEAFNAERRVLGEEHRNTIFSLNNLAYLYDLQGKYAQAEPLYNKVLEVQRRLLGEEHPDTLATINNLAILYREEGKNEKAEPLLTKALEVERRTLGNEHPSTLSTTNSLAALYESEGKYAQAESLFAKVLEIRRRMFGPEDRRTLLNMNDLAEVYRMQGRYAQAEPLAIKTLDISGRVLGNEHEDTLASMNGLGILYRCEGKYVQAGPLLMKTLEARQRLLGAEHPDTLANRNDLAALYRSEGKYVEAEALFTSVLNARRRVLGPEHPDTTDVMVLLAEVRLQQKQYAAAEPLLREALRNDEKTAPDGWRRFRSQSLLGASLAGQGKQADAETALVSGYQGMIARQATIPYEAQLALTQAREWIVQLYEGWAKPEKAAAWRAQVQTKRR
ncbi:MAG: serine/threonine-protein kinase [Bryobacteraceae bacterium]